jgi:hypothetical protein
MNVKATMYCYILEGAIKEVQGVKEILFVELSYVGPMASSCLPFMYAHWTY